MMYNPKSFKLKKEDQYVINLSIFKVTFFKNGTLHEQILFIFPLFIFIRGDYPLFAFLLHFSIYPHNYAIIQIKN